MTDRTVSKAKADLPPLHPTALTVGAWRDLREVFPRFWPLWIVWSIYGAGSIYWEHSVSTGQGLTSPVGLAYLAVSSMVVAVLSGAATRGLLGGATPWWTLDARLGRYVILMGSGNFLLQAPALVQSADRAHLNAANAGGVMLLSLLQLVILIVFLWAAVRLLLWPIGQLDEGGEMTARKSWRQMRGAFWPYFGASILAGGGPAIVTVALLFQFQQHGALWGLIAQAPLAGLMGLIFAAVTVQIYRTRVTGPDKLAEVFD